MLRNWPRDSDLVLVRHRNQLHQSVIRHRGDPYRVEGVPKSRSVWKDWPELDVGLSCSAGGSALTWAAPWEAYAWFLRVWCRRGGKNEWGASGVFEGVLMRYATGEMIGFDARAVLGRVTMGHFGSSRLIHRHLYSICILECAETLRFRGPLCLI